MCFRASKADEGSTACAVHASTDKSKDSSIQTSRADGLQYSIFPSLFQHTSVRRPVSSSRFPRSMSAKSSEGSIHGIRRDAPELTLQWPDGSPIKSRRTVQQYLENELSYLSGEIHRPYITSQTNYSLAELDPSVTTRYRLESTGYCTVANLVGNVTPIATNAHRTTVVGRHDRSTSTPSQLTLTPPCSAFLSGPDFLTAGHVRIDVLRLNRFEETRLLSGESMLIMHHDYHEGTDDPGMLTNSQRGMSYRNLPRLVVAGTQPLVGSRDPEILFASFDLQGDPLPKQESSACTETSAVPLNGEQHPQEYSMT